VDRATLKESRSDDLQYVDDPEYLDFFAIFFANGELNAPAECKIALNPFSHNETWKKAQLQAARHRNGHRIFSKILHQKSVLRNRPIYRHCGMLLRGWEGGGVASAHQEYGSRSSSFL
jgi:hypothetical protein